MHVSKLGMALLLASGLMTVNAVAWAADVPGTVIVSDRDAADDRVAFTATASAGNLGQQENALIADLQNGDASARAVAIDTVPGAVVATVLEIRQATRTRHRGRRGELQQSSHVEASFVVFDNLVDLNVLGSGTELAPGCKGKVKVEDGDGDGSQDEAKWTYRCAPGAFADAIADIDGDSPVVSRTAAQAAVGTARVRIEGKTVSPPALLSNAVDEVRREL